MNQQSSDIACGVDNSIDEKDIGAGDQGMMFGYATNETKNYMPYPIYIAHKLSQQLRKVYEIKNIPLPDPAGGFLMDVYFAFLVTIDLITNSVAIISTIAIGRTISQLRMKPAKM